jgi:hypothetical protein
MIAPNRKWWPPAAIAGLLAGDVMAMPTIPSHTVELRIGVVSDTFQQPLLFEATGLPKSQLERLKSLRTFDPAFSKVFAVYVVSDTPEVANEDLPSISGYYVIDGSRLTFVPRHPLKAGLTYRAVLRIPEGTGLDDRASTALQVERKIVVPQRHESPAPKSVVTNVFPSGDVLPENHLRFYIHFSQPIMRGAAYRHLELLDESGYPIESPFLELGEELWDPGRQRFTLLLDPGRVKRHLKPRDELGPVLVKGRKYTLLIKGDWLDVNGQTLAREYRKEFTAGPALAAPIDVTQWEVHPPASGTKQPFVVEFPRSLDRALLARALWIVNAEGKEVAGQADITREERRWSFSPTAAWLPGNYELRVDTDLEDSAGNRIGRPFDFDLQQPITGSIDGLVKPLHFEISTRGSSAAATKPDRPLVVD